MRVHDWTGFAALGAGILGLIGLTRGMLETALMCGLQIHLQARLTIPDTYRTAQARHAARLHQIARVITSEPTLLDFDLKRINDDLTQAIDTGDEEAISRAFDALKDLKALVEKGGE